jgi:hypothetical protein
MSRKDKPTTNASGRRTEQAGSRQAKRSAAKPSPAHKQSSEPSAAKRSAAKRSAAVPSPGKRSGEHAEQTRSPGADASRDDGPSAAPPGSERFRDEQRDDETPRYGGGPWQVADERGDRRFGNARNDDADPSELAPGEADNDDDESPGAADPELAAAEAAGEIESGGQRAGMRRGEKPRKVKGRER